MQSCLFAVQVRTGAETAFVERLKRLSFENVSRVIFLQRRMNIRRGGKNLLELNPVFPGYVFIETLETGVTNGDFMEIKKQKDFIHFLPSNENLQKLSENDSSVVNSFLRFGTIAEPSSAYFDENDRIVITDGPMKGLEGLIKSVDKRKKRVRIVTDFMGVNVKVDLSYNLVEKK